MVKILSSFRDTRTQQRLYFYIALLVAFVGTIPLWAGRFMISSMILIFVYLAAAAMWSFMAEHAGMVSLGQQMFFGLGAYVVAILSEPLFKIGLPIWLSILTAGLLGSIFAAALSFPLLRLRGIYFAIGSWIVAEIVLLVFDGWEYVGDQVVFRSAYDLSVTLIYYSALVIALLSIFIVYFLFRSKLGFGLRAIGANEDAASDVGVDSFRCKAYVFIIAAFVTTLAGTINLLHHAYLTPRTAFSIEWTIKNLFISVIGGMGTIIGTILGSVIFVLVKNLLAARIGLSLLLQGVIVLVTLMLLPRGIWGSISRKLGLKPPI